MDRLRIYVCPWSTYQEGRKFHLGERTDFNSEELALAQGLYQACVGKCHQWKTDESRQWSHWSVRYID